MEASESNYLAAVVFRSFTECPPAVPELPRIYYITLSAAAVVAPDYCRLELFSFLA